LHRNATRELDDGPFHGYIGAAPTRRKITFVGLVIWPEMSPFAGEATLWRTLKTKNALLRSTEEIIAEELVLPLLITAVPDWAELSAAADAACTPTHSNNTTTSERTKYDNRGLSATLPGNVLLCVANRKFWSR
jgi:hypothetical protein